MLLHNAACKSHHSSYHRPHLPTSFQRALWVFSCLVFLMKQRHSRRSTVLPHGLTCLGPVAYLLLLKSEAVQLSFVSSNPWKLKSEVKDKTPMKTDFWSKKFRQTGEAAWPEVLIVFCMIYFFLGHAQNALKSSNEDRARANSIVMVKTRSTRDN